MEKPESMNGDHSALWDRIREAEKNITDGQADFALIIAGIIKKQAELKTNQDWIQRLVFATFMAVVVTRLF